AATLVNSWSDQVFISKDSVLGNTDDIFLGSFTHTGTLAVDGSYQQTQTVHLPEGISGTYQFFVRVDATNAVNEFVLEGNNITASATTTQVTLAPYADLTVTSVTAPDLVVGNPAAIEVSWTVNNQGTGAGRTSPWTDRILVSRNAAYGDSDDQVVADFAHSGALNVGESYSRTEHVTLPGGLSGLYHVFVVTDVANQVYEYTFENNNLKEASQLLGVSPVPFGDLVVSDVVVPATG